jgi:hypothetical protein
MRADAPGANKLGGRCCDCGIDTLASNEWYVVKDDVWDQAWVGRCRSQYVIPGSGGLIDEFLCIGCLEQRIGRTLCHTDFTDAPINNPNRYPNKVHSERLLDRFRG